MHNQTSLKFPIETGRWINTAKELRLCSFCNKKKLEMNITFYLHVQMTELFN